MATLTVTIDQTERWWNSLREYQAAEWLRKHGISTELADYCWYQLDHLEQDAIRALSDLESALTQGENQ